MSARYTAIRSSSGGSNRKQRGRKAPFFRFRSSLVFEARCRGNLSVCRVVYGGLQSRSRRSGRNRGQTR